MFHRGQKVVCVDADFNRPDGNEPKHGEIVTISGLGNEPNTIYLHEYPVNKGGYGQYFYTRRFRPLSDVSHELTSDLVGELEKEFNQLINS